MRSLSVFNQLSADGYFVDRRGDMSWAHNPAPDAEWSAFVAGNAKGGGQLVFGRVTYQMMAGYWPTPQALKDNPVVAERMNALPKVVFSRTLERATWSNTQLLKGDLAEEVRALKAAAGDSMVIMGSGTIVSQLTQAGLIDEYQIVVIPVVLGGGRSMFDGVEARLDLRMRSSRAFANGNVVNTYAPTA